ncbi:MAG: hypothetical protein ABIA37_04315 [Candidatus Woesearchaeota archaeon]
MLKKRFRTDRCRHNSAFFSSKENFAKMNKLTAKSSKTGQITIFVILGILLLLALVLVVLFKKEAIVFKPEELIPTEKGKVENFIVSCISQIGEEAIYTIGLQGGYLNISSEIATDSNQHLKLSPYNLVPYWARGESKRIPTLEEIKADLDSKIEADLKSCLLGREAFQESYDIIEKSAIVANTNIVDQKVIFNVRWNLEIQDKGGEKITELIDHTAESDIKLKRTYETAKAIIDTEMNEKKFELLTIDMLSLDHDNVPIAGVEMSCSKKQWKVNEAKDTLKSMLRVNLHQVKVSGTDYVAFPDTLPYYQNHYIWDAGVIYPEVGVNFNFNDNFPFYFEVSPRDGNTMKSGMTGGTEMLSAVCVQLWKFTYSVMYPVLVEVRDETTDFVFNTAFTVHIKNNRADRSGEILTPPTTLIDFSESEAYCKLRDIPITIYTYELIENNETGVYSREPLEEVNLSYTCLKYKCEIGQTEYGFAGLGDIAAYKTNFPYCSGGILRGVKEGYKENWERVVANQEKQVDLNLIPLSKFAGSKIKIVKHDFDNLNKTKSIGSGETASIKISRNKESWGSHDSTLIVSPDLDPGLLNESYLEFIGGTDYTYQLEVYLMDEEGITGGYAGNWTVDWEKLKLANEITLPVLSKDQFKSDIELFDFMANLDNYSMKLTPEIK